MPNECLVAIMTRPLTKPGRARLEDEISYMRLKQLTNHNKAL